MASRKELDILFKATNISKSFGQFKANIDINISINKGEIHALLIKRAIEPYMGVWAIPGDLVYPDEDLTDAASRILTELTKVKGVTLHQGQTFGKPDRHPQGRVITNAYFALVRKEDINAVADSWAEEVKWVPIRESLQLAFDHNEILESTFELLC